jgi:hypothetical protein
LPQATYQCALSLRLGFSRAREAEHLAKADRWGMLCHMATTRIRRTPEQKLADLEKQIAKARQVLKKDQRKLETRQKVILGGALLDMLKGGHSRQAEARIVYDAIVPNLLRAQDRAAFDLKPRTDV